MILKLCFNILKKNEANEIIGSTEHVFAVIFGLQFIFKAYSKIY